MPALPGQENASLKPAVAALMGAPALPSQENAPKQTPAVAAGAPAGRSPSHSLVRTPGHNKTVARESRAAVPSPGSGP